MQCDHSRWTYVVREMSFTYILAQVGKSYHHTDWLKKGQPRESHESLLSGLAFVTTEAYWRDQTTFHGAADLARCLSYPL